MCGYKREPQKACVRDCVLVPGEKLMLRTDCSEEEGSGCGEEADSERTEAVCPARRGLRRSPKYVDK